MRRPVYKTVRLAAITLLCSFSLSACLDASRKIDQYAKHAKLTRTTLLGDPFRHVVYIKPGINSGQSLHIYIEGDGTPWRRGTQIAKDPTSKKPISLHLMAQAPQAAIYLGRPCYLGLSQDPACNSDYWTSHRYAKIVVKSMAKVANEYIAKNTISEVTLLGHSGGGTLAVLLANKIHKVKKVITIAANLNTEKWTQHHGYLPLTGSLNPIEDADLSNIEHIHYIGGKDRVIPLQMVEDFARKNGGKLRIVADFTHHCCWQDNWPQWLEE